MSNFSVSTHLKSNRCITDDTELVLLLVRELMQRAKRAIILPNTLSDEEYTMLANGKTEAHDPENIARIADWVSTIPE